MKVHKVNFMPFIKIVKPYKVNRSSSVIVLPAGWTGNEKRLTVAADQVALLVPEGLTQQDVERDIVILMKSLRGSATWSHLLKKKPEETRQRTIEIE